MKIERKKVQTIIEQLLQEALEGYSTPSMNNEARTILLASDVIIKQLLRAKSIYDKHKNDPSFWQQQNASAPVSPSSLLPKKGSKYSPPRPVTVQNASVAHFWPLEVFQKVIIDPLTEVRTHLIATKEFVNKSLEQEKHEIIAFIGKIIHDVSLIVDPKDRESLLPAPAGRPKEKNLSAYSAAKQKFDNSHSLAPGFKGPLHPNQQFIQPPLSNQNAGPQPTVPKDFNQFHIEAIQQRFEHVVASYIQDAFELYKKARQMFQMVSNPKSVPSQNSLFLQNQQALKVLESVDEEVIQYYTLVESLFRALFSIQDDMNSHLTSSMEKLFGEKPLPNPSSPRYDINYKDNVRQRKAAERKDTLARMLMHGTKGPNHDIRPDDPYWTNEKPFSFNKDVFLGFLTNQLEDHEKAPDGVMRPSRLTKEFSYEHKKAKVISSLIDHLKHQDNKIFNLLQVSGVGGASKDGPVHEFLWDNKKGDYIFPTEVRAMWQNMVAIKKMYKQKFAEIYSTFETLEYEDVEAVLHNLQNPNGPQKETVQKYKDIKEFFTKESDNMKNIIRAIQFYKVQFKSIMNKMMTGEEFEATMQPQGQGYQQVSQLPQIANQIDAERAEKIRQRQETWQKMQASGLVNEPMPDWAYSK